MTDLEPPVEGEEQKLAGLSDEEAHLRLLANGPDGLPSQRPNGWLKTLLSVLREPMLLLLVSIATLYIVVGERSEAVTIAVAVLGIVGVTVLQESRAERALTALRDLSAPRAHVIRNGMPTVIDRASLVEGDLILFREGDRIPADAVVVAGNDLTVDESALTGESAPVTKFPGRPDSTMLPPGGDGTAFVYSGTLVVRGHGRALIRRTGSRSEIGKIGASLQNVPTRKSPIRLETARLVRTMAALGGVLCLAAVGIYAVRGRFEEGLLIGLTMAISIVPEEIPVVITILTALGAWRIAKSNVLTRRIPAIETLGVASTLCVDKTGTITQNSMVVAKVVVDDVIYDVSEDLALAPDSVRDLAKVAILASEATPTDPMEKALWRLSTSLGGSHRTFGVPIAEYGISPQLLAVSYLWCQPASLRPMIATKGAPEAVAALCDMTPLAVAAMRRSVEALTDDGYRVLAVASGEWPDGDLPKHHHQLAPRFLGLVALMDPIRPAVPQAVRECHKAGLHVAMLTGDHPGTARSIARQVGIRGDEVLTGAELSALTDDALRERVRTCRVFARIVPEQKLRLVRAFQANGEVVAMTGDGVNDAPALRAADIGIAMGARGTDVARESADLVLVDDDFTSIVSSIRLGRRIYDNLCHAVGYIVAVHLPVAGLTIVPVLLGWPLVLLPIHIVLLELTVDPACATVFEAQSEAKDIMDRPPRPRDARLISSTSLGKSLIQGAVAFAGTFAVFFVAMRISGDPDWARTLAFGTLIVTNLSMIVQNTSGSEPIWRTLRSPSAALVAVTLGVVTGMLLLILVPVIRERAHFSAISLGQAVVACAVGFASVFWIEAVKFLKAYRRGDLAQSKSII
ncbi:MAG: cation-translocating P-type ATPase [Fimbriimonas sp.]